MLASMSWGANDKLFRTGSFVFLFSEPQIGSQNFRNRTMWCILLISRLFDEEVKAGYFQKGGVSPPREFPGDFFCSPLSCGVLAKWSDTVSAVLITF